MSGLTKRSNDALHANPDTFNYYRSSDIRLTTAGSDVYWAVTAVMVVATIAFVGMSFTVPRRNRIFHYITAAITLVAAIAYFTMASNLGYAPIAVEFRRSDPRVAGLTREIFYVRYIDWFVTTPLLLLDLLLTCALPWPTILYTILLDEVMIVTGLVGALVASSYKWGYFVFAMVALCFIAYNVTIVGRSYARNINAEVSKVYLMTGTWTIFLWFMYPIAWGVSEGGNVIAPDSEAVFYGVLDILAKPVFGALLLWGHRNIDPAVLGLHIRDYEDDMTNEKYPAGAGAGPGTGVGTGSAGAYNTNEGTTGGVVNGHHNAAGDATGVSTGVAGANHRNTSVV